MTEPANDATPDLFYHGTRADLAIGDVLRPGFASNYGAGKPSSWVYFTATLDAAIWGAELAAGAGRQRIYIVEPLGAMVDDPNLTDKKFPGNPTRSYRTQAGLRITGEVEHWQGHAPERVEAMKENLRRLKEAGTATIID